MNNIYSLCTLQEAQPLQEPGIIYLFVQIHKLDKKTNKQKKGPGHDEWLIQGYIHD